MPRFDILPLNDFAADFSGLPVIAIRMGAAGMQPALGCGALTAALRYAARPLHGADDLTILFTPGQA
ncbi:MAG TPA: hypothetical protein VHC90_10715 [Bryobacteraceae bacterium]|nr:hypothetical protein [Bryobacteraceae bacterium]